MGDAARVVTDTDADKTSSPAPRRDPDAPAPPVHDAPGTDNQGMQNAPPAAGPANAPVTPAGGLAPSGDAGGPAAPTAQGPGTATSPKVPTASAPAPKPPSPGTGGVFPREIVFPQWTIVSKQDMKFPLLKLGPYVKMLWVEPIILPPPVFLITVAVGVRVGLVVDLHVQLGPVVMREARLWLDPARKRYSGTAQMSAAASLGPRATLTGALFGSGHWLGIAELLRLEGALRGVGEAMAIVAVTPSVTLLYDAGQLTFNARPQLEAGLALTFDLYADAFAAVLKRVVWKRTWSLMHRHWGGGVRMGTSLSLDYVGGKFQPIRNEPFAERTSIDDLLADLREPPKGGKINTFGDTPQPLRPRLAGLFSQKGLDPQLVLFALAEATPAERAAVLADPDVMEDVRKATGDALWPTAQRILKSSPSETVPSLDEGTVFLVNRHIRLARYPDALRVAVARLQSQGFVNATLAVFAHQRETKHGEGLTSTNYDVDPKTGDYIPRKPSQISIYDPAFVNAPWLYSTVMHEYMHSLQHQQRVTAAQFKDPESIDRGEVESYLWEIEHAMGSGVLASREQMVELGKRLTDHYNALTKSKPQYRVRYEAAMQRVDAARAARTPINLTGTVADSQKRVQDSSKEIAALVATRPDPTRDPKGAADTDRKIAAIQRAREDALIEVVLAQNPGVEVVDRAKNIFRFAVTDEYGHVRYLYGGIQVVWHLSGISPSVFPLGAGMGAQPTRPGDTARMGVGGSGIQGRVQPFPGDIDLVEEIDVTAPNKAKAGEAIADIIIGFVSRNQATTEYEFLRMIMFTKVGRKQWLNSGIMRAAGHKPTRAALARDCSEIGEGNVNTFWRAYIEDKSSSAGKRYIDMTKLLNIRAFSSTTGKEMFGTITLSQFQVAYLDRPDAIPPASLGAYAAALRQAALEEAGRGNWLKAAKRAFNYFMAIGDMEAMSQLQPAFITPHAEVNQQLAVIEAIARSLIPDRPGDDSWKSRILTVSSATPMLNKAADTIAAKLPAGTGRSPADIASDIRNAALDLRGDTRGIVTPSAVLARKLDKLMHEAKDLVNAGVRPIVEPVIRSRIGVSPPAGSARHASPAEVEALTQKEEEDAPF